MPNATSGTIAAARAYAGAGNFKLAEQHLKRVLAADPNDDDACEVWCELLTKQKKFAELETFAKSWIGRDGQNERAYTSLFGSYAARKDRRQCNGRPGAVSRAFFPSRSCNISRFKTCWTSTARRKRQATI